MSIFNNHLETTELLVKYGARTSNPPRFTNSRFNMAVQPINHAVNNNQYRILIEAGADINPAYPKSTCLPLPIHDYKCPRTIIESAIILNEGNIKSYEEKLNGEKEKEPVSRIKNF
ncbi:5994_t:CDS:2 [Rhizophagus irregularis]|nr:5994_t:CDS:2 [Rhizophagus irregularis]